MRTCATLTASPVIRSRRPSPARGFTLIEILVVVLIVAILSGVVVANLPGFVRSGDLDEEANRLQALLALARTESQLQAREMGFRVLADGYEFYGFDDVQQRWQRLEQRPLAARRLPPGIALSLRVEASDLALPDPEDDSPGTTAAMPPVLLLSSGETTPFELTLESAGQRRTLVSDGYGDLAWAEQDGS